MNNSEDYIHIDNKNEIDIFVNNICLMVPKEKQLCLQMLIVGI